MNRSLFKGRGEVGLKIVEDLYQNIHSGYLQKGELWVRV